jgi:GxxExxY protein
MDEKEVLNSLTEKIISAAIAVHRELGPGTLESAYEACLTYELLSRGLSLSVRSLCRSSIEGKQWTADIASTSW